VTTERAPEPAPDRLLERSSEAPGDEPLGSDDPLGSRDVLDPADVSRTLSRMAHQLLEHTNGGRDVLLVGIPTRGVILAHRLAAKFVEFEGLAVPVGSLDTTMYRDDLRLHGVRPVGRTDVPGSVDDKIVVLVDDVLYSGRTVRAALDALSDLGRPRAVQLAVLVDRGHRELPIRADYVGKNLPTSQGETVRVLLEEIDGRDGVAIERRVDARAGRLDRHDGEGS
jgi:pyrimidine operon attenuation protein/uracil phosphoribosyltransferase